MSQDIQKHSTGQEKALLVLLFTGVFLFIAFHVSPLWGYSYLIWYGGFMAGLGAIALINAALLTGYKNAFLFFALGAAIGFTMETIGVSTGLIFGPYTYSEKLGPKLGTVPYVIPLCWFGIVYLAHMLSNFIVFAKPVLLSSSLVRLLLMSAITAMIATAFDVAVDPVLSNKAVNLWVWTDGGDFFGVPFRNFQGWLITAFLIDATYRIASQKITSPPLTTKPGPIILSIIAVWTALAMGFMLLGYPLETQIIAAFALFPPAAFAITSIYQRG